MATYSELRALFDNSDLTEKIEVGVVKAANDLLDAAVPTAADKTWAAAVLGNPNGEATKALRYLLAENSGISVALILASGDTAIQTNVDSVVPKLVDAMAGV